MQINMLCRAGIRKATDTRVVDYVSSLNLLHPVQMQLLTYLNIQHTTSHSRPDASSDVALIKRFLTRKVAATWTAAQQPRRCNVYSKCNWRSADQPSVQAKESLDSKVDFMVNILTNEQLQVEVVTGMDGSSLEEEGSGRRPVLPECWVVL